MSYKTSKEFLRLFGYESLENLPELPKYKMDENRQIVIDDIVEEKNIPDNENEEEEKKDIENEVKGKENNNNE